MLPGTSSGSRLPVTHEGTTAGDYRVPHFFGMHSLQALPLVAIALRRVGRHLPAFVDDAVQHRLVVLAAIGYAAALVLLTVEAAMGRPVTSPTVGLALAGTALLGALALAALLAIL